MSSADFLSVLFIALGLSADCFAVALSGSIALGKTSAAPLFRLSTAFGGFQAIMCLLGWLAGQTVVNFIAEYDHWVAFGLLAIVGSRMLWEAFHDDDAREKNADITRGLLLLTVSLATSIDSLAVGLSFAFLQVNIWLASLTIGVTAFAVTALSFVVGRKAGQLMGKRAEAVGGIILILIGLRILIEHLLEG
ncbi:MAG: manganese efflux pump [Chloroflexi bacterium]|nr:manganese efflux pump [Chloroflexota bacterium]MBM3172381.1 manganese efflux pump [Chloroflexota bacterium]MBM3174807.1 manganese efflux pump [Chloroflexota bacterium]MBM4449983.1 manganese efflux pump [Chloroflexota bacterium]